jgi:hypothetical protein
MRLTFNNLMALWLLLSLSSVLPHLVMKIREDVMVSVGSCTSASCNMNAKQSGFCCHAKLIYRGGDCLSTPDPETGKKPLFVAPSCKTSSPDAMMVTQLNPTTLATDIQARLSVKTSATTYLPFKSTSSENLTSPPDKIPIA